MKKGLKMDRLMNKVDVSLVSVCIPCYNAEKTIAETLDSILAQTYSNIEIIVSDNQSTDSTKEVVSSYAKHGIRLVENPPVEDDDSRIFGAFDNWDHALSQGEGDFLCLYHADDLYDPEIIEKEVKFLLEHPAAGCVLTLKTPIDANGKEIAMPKRHQEVSLGGDKSFAFYDFMEMLLGHQHFVSTPTLMLRKEVVSSIGKFNEQDFLSAADLDYLIRVSKDFHIGVIDEKLHRYRVTEHHYTAQMNKARIDIADYFEVIGSYLKSTDTNASFSKHSLHKHDMFMRNDMARCAWYLYQQNKAWQARKMLRSAVDFSWILTCLKSMHGVKILGASCLVYMMTLFSTSKNEDEG